MLFPVGVGKPPPLNLTHQVPPWWEEVSSAWLVMSFRGGLGGGCCAEGKAHLPPPQYKGQVNLHVFEDWCGGAVGHLRRNLHFPLFPHVSASGSELAGGGGQGRTGKGFDVRGHCPPRLAPP